MLGFFLLKIWILHPGHVVEVLPASDLTCGDITPHSNLGKAAVLAFACTLRESHVVVAVTILLVDVDDAEIAHLTVARTVRALLPAVAANLGLAAVLCAQLQFGLRVRIGSALHTHGSGYA